MVEEVKETLKPDPESEETLSAEKIKQDVERLREELDKLKYQKERRGK